jgi:hypothetical protein
VAAPHPRPVSRPYPLVPRIIHHNGRLKLAALGLAFVLWALVRAEPTTGVGVDVFTIPVRAQVGDMDWALLGEPDPSTVQVRLRGPTQDLIRLAREGTTVRVPLDSVTSGDTLVQLRRDWVVLGSSGVVVEDIAPASVRLALQPTVTAAVPLRIATRGSLPGALALSAPVALDPPTVRVRGPAHRVRGLDSISAGPLDLRDLSESGVHRLPVDTTGLGDLAVEPLAAAAVVHLEPAVERTLSEVRVVVEAPSDGSVPSAAFVVAPGAIEVRLSGARTAVAAARAEDVRAVVAWEAARAVPAGEARVVPIQLHGVPALVRAFSGADSVMVERRPR